MKNYLSNMLIIALVMISFNSQPENFITSGRIIRDRCRNNRPSPVCGGDGRTYQNPCYARRARVEIAYVGECVNCE